MFSHEQPAGDEMHVKAGMAVDATLELEMLMGGVVVHDHVDLHVFCNHINDGAQERQLPWWRCRSSHIEIAWPSSAWTAAKSVAVSFHLPSWVTVPQRPFFIGKPGWGEVQSLALALLVGAQYDAVFGYVTVNGHVAGDPDQQTHYRQITHRIRRPY